MLNKVFSLLAFMFAFSLAGASAQYEKVILAPAEIRAASANAFFEGSYKADGKIVKWRVDFNKTSNKVLSVTFKHPNGDGPQNQYMPPSEFWNRMGNCISSTGGNSTGTGNACISSLIDKANTDCLYSVTTGSIATMSIHCWML